MSNSNDQSDNCMSKTMRVYNDCVDDPVYQKPGFYDGLCRDYSPPRPENLEPKKMYDVGTYAYSKLQLPSPTIKMSGASGYTTEPPMTAGESSGAGSSGQQHASSAGAAADATTYMGGAQSGNGEESGGQERTNYGTFANPDYKGKSKQL